MIGQLTACIDRQVRSIPFVLGHSKQSCRFFLLEASKDQLLKESYRGMLDQTSCTNRPAVSVRFSHVRASTSDYRALVGLATSSRTSCCSRSIVHIGDIFNNYHSSLAALAYVAPSGLTIQLMTTLLRLRVRARITRLGLFGDRAPHCWLLDDPGAPGGCTPKGFIG